MKYNGHTIYNGWITGKINNSDFKLQVWKNEPGEGNKRFKTYGRIKEGSKRKIIYQWYQMIDDSWAYLVRTDDSSKRPWKDFINIKPYDKLNALKSAEEIANQLESRKPDYIEKTMKEMHFRHKGTKSCGHCKFVKLFDFDNKTHSVCYICGFLKVE